MRGLIIVIIVVITFFTSLLLFINKKNINSISYEPPNDALYYGEDIKIYLECGDILAGSLTLPKESIQNFPAVVLITGSSAHDRDNSKPDRSAESYRPFRQIADKLSSNGIAVLRMDDRGVGASSGGDINSMTTIERGADIRECIKYLRKRFDIDSSRIGLIGLSEGASIAHIIAASDKSIKIIVLLSGIGSKGKDIINYQVNNGVINRDNLPKLLEKDKNFNYLYNFDPLQTAKLVKQPVLIINGENDKRVPSSDAYKLLDAITSNGNNNVTIYILPKYNHLLLKESKSGVETKYGKISSNQIPDQVLSIILEWVLKEI